MNKKLFFILWFFHIFKPIWLVSYYIPAIGSLRALPRLFLYVFCLYFFFTSSKKRHDTSFLLFCIAILLSVLFAYNFGIARTIAEEYFDYYLMFVFCLSVIDDEDAFDFFYNTLLCGFVYYGVWGLINRGVVPFHPFLGDEDAYGPYMAMGAVIFYFSAFAKRNLYKKLMLCSLISVAGVVISFARGAVVGLVAIFIYVWIKSEKKMATLMTIVLTCMAALAVSVLFFDEGKYLDEMKSITEASQETESDRIFYWTKAIKIFMDNPILGVGPRNYGVVLSKYISREESIDRGFFTGFWYGRVPHSLYFQLLSEQGIIGVLSLIFTLSVFWKRMSSLHQKNNESNESVQLKYYNYSLALKGAMLVFLITGLFYDFLYSSLLFELFLIAGVLHSLKPKGNPNVA